MIRKNRIYQTSSVVILLLTLFVSSCKKEEEVKAPSFANSAIDVITPISARCVASVNAEGSSPIDDRGVCWSTESMPDISDSKIYSGSGTGEYIAILTGLTPQTTYYARAFASNSAGTTYGDEITFTTTEDLTGETGTMTDKQGHVYPTVGIGSQVWMAANLKATRFNDSTEIAYVDEDGDWMDLISPAYCYYGNLEGNGATYGVLYNWYAAASSILCPPGWHLPSDAEWTQLSVFLGGDEEAGAQLKETGTGHWRSPNGDATDAYGFKALPAGYRALIGVYSSVEESAVFWSFTGNSVSEAYCRLMEYQNNLLARVSISTKVGCSIRLVKDN